MRGMGLLAFILAAAISLPAVAAPGAGVTDATSWVSLIDQGQYERGWSDAGTLFKTRIAQPDWAREIKPIRRPLGAVVSRKLVGDDEVKSLPGAPDGDYAILRFDTDFSNKHTSVETIVLAREAGGWKVDGYFIK